MVQEVERDASGEDGVCKAVGGLHRGDADEAEKEARSDDREGIKDAWRINNHGQKVL